MRFSTLFSVFLATLSVGVGASPIGAPSDVREFSGDLSNDSVDYGDVEKRAPTKETDRLKQMQKDLGSDKLQQGKEYAIQVTWTKGKPGSLTGIDTPAQREMKKTRERYEFDHTAIIVGKVEKVQDPKNKKKYELDFRGNFYHLGSTTIGSGNNEWFKTEPEKGKEWKESKTDKTLKFSHLKDISGDWKSKVEHAEKAAAEVSSKNGNKWKGGKNDCQTYVDAFKDAL